MRGSIASQVENVFSLPAIFQTLLVNVSLDKNAHMHDKNGNRTAAGKFNFFSGHRMLLPFQLLCTPVDSEVLVR